MKMNEELHNNFGDDIFNQLMMAEMSDEHEREMTWLRTALDEMTEIKKTITPDEKKSLLRGMLLTRATDNGLKRLFLAGEITYQGRSFQGKGFRSLGQEAIYGAMLKLNTGTKYNFGEKYLGDLAAPLIRDLGVFLAMSDGDVATVINAQAGKAGKPCDGRDLHVGDFDRGVLIPAAPLAIASSTLIGLALAMKIKKESRVAVSFIGEGGSSLGEWHEAINCASVMQLPMIFCIENNQTALSTPVSSQCRAWRFADKGRGYGINSLSVDGNDVEAVTCAFKFAADEARRGRGPILIELVTMRMCGHAHHDDMLYLGKDPKLSLAIEPPHDGGYVDKALYEKWRAKDPIARYRAKLVHEGVIEEKDIAEFEEHALAKVENAIADVIARDWPTLENDDQALVFKAPWKFKNARVAVTNNYRFSKNGVTYLQAIADAIEESLRKNSLARVIGEDVAPPYGNAFMLFRSINADFADRFINTPIAENAIVGACVGMALAGMKPIGEMQFNDFIACAMDQVVNNVAKHFFRTGLNLPMVLRLPYGGLRRAGPYHSQDTSPWFYTTPGLKIMAPSTPHDAYHMLLRAVDDPDPVLFYEHIALYRDPNIKQEINALIADIDGAAVVMNGDDITIISYGAYVHKAVSAAEKLCELHKKTADVIDLRYLSPIDFDTIYASVKKTSRVLLVGEDKKAGGILEMVASKIAQEQFFNLDAPMVVLGSRDVPVPYAPSLEDAYLVSTEHIVDEAMKLINA